MLSTEGTYPFHQGGVSTWCDTMVKNLTGIEYVIYSIIMNPHVTQKYELPENTVMIKVPLWGTEDPSEHLTTPFSTTYMSKRKTGNKVIRESFIPLFKDLIEEIVKSEKDTLRFGHTLLELYRYFKVYDYKSSFKSEQAWGVYKDIIFKYSADSSNKLAQPSVYDLIQSLGWLYRFLTILNTPLPQVDVTHSAAAAFCGIPCALAKLENKTPFLLTEHGVYLREQYLFMSRRGYSTYLNTFLIRMIHSVAGLNYILADQVSPVCMYNTRWETKFGVVPSANKVIYNGVNREVFSPKSDFHTNSKPTVVAVARIDPVKDLITLIKAAVIVKERIPAVMFIVYGTVSVPDYYEECLSLVKELNLKETFIFAGHTNDVPSAYRSGDVIALSSITEAFPYSVVEAMMTGKAVVATDVGGVKEAIGDCGIVVRPRNPEQFANALVLLLEQPSLRETIGKEARERALNYFAIERALELYSDSYKKLAAGVFETEVLTISLRRQKILAEKGYALAAFGYWQEAADQFRLAIEACVDSSAVPVLLTEIGGVYNNLGKYDMAFLELEKAQAMFEFIQSKKA